MEMSRQRNDDKNIMIWNQADLALNSGLGRIIWAGYFNLSGFIWKLGL